MRTTTNLPAASAGTVTLGGDLSVNRLGFGAMRLTGRGIWGEPTDPAECKRVLRRAIELGVTFFDTADSYGPSVSERLIAETLYPYPQGLVIATKGGLVRPGPGLWVPNGRPEHLRRALEGSLHRLKLERIDLYQFHRPDPAVPLEESVGTLAEMQREGKIRHIGISNVELGQLERARKVARIVSVQNLYNLTHRASEDVLDYCERQGLVFIPWAPLGGGPLTGRSRLLGHIARLTGSGRLPDRIARAHRATRVEITLAWALQRSPVTLVIPGTSKVSHLEENVAAASITLSPGDVASLARQ
jgi:aryl-alcohol dehydrogenase-like predicted oxidoreductase